MDKEYEEYEEYTIFEAEKAFKDSKNLEIELIRLIENKSTENLNIVISLIKAPYPSYTITSNIRACALSAMCWDKEGFLRLAEIISSRDMDMNDIVAATIETLTYIASTYPNENIEIEYFEDEYPVLWMKINEERKKLPEVFTFYAKETLIENIIDHDFLQVLAILRSLTNMSIKFSGDGNRGKRAFNTLLAACSNKWLRINKEGLKEYQRLIQKPVVSEEEIHQHIFKNPYLLDPFYSFVWSKPKLGEKLIADFLIRLMDDTYIVVEIEKPTDPIMNSKGDLSYQTTHAMRQALEYRNWLKYNHLYAKENFENITEPTCLAIIGIEQSLSKKQKELLRIHNENNNVKIVGFDWLHRRAQTVLDNLIRHGLDRFDL